MSPAAYVTILCIVASTVALRVSAAETLCDTFSPVATEDSINADATAEMISPFLIPQGFTQKVIASRNAQLALGHSNSGNWDMITSNETGPDAGRYLLTVFETNASGVQRTDLQTGETVTIVPSGAQSTVAFDASNWTPWESQVSAEESWGPEVTGAACLKSLITSPPPKTVANGDQFLFFAATTTDDVFTVDLAKNEVKVFADRSTTNAATGLPVGEVFNNADNLVIDAEGNIYIAEDDSDINGLHRANIWMATDAEHNGVAESVAAWVTMKTSGAEPTGLYFDRFNPNVAYVNVQHPGSGNDVMVQLTAVPERTSTVTVLPAAISVALALRARRVKKS